MKRNSKLYSAMLAGVFLVWGLMLGPAASAADQNPCSEDIAKFCKDVKPGQQALMQCLEKNEAQLSDACKTYEAKMEKPRMESRETAAQQMKIRQACGMDSIKFCNDAKSISNGVDVCLKEHTGELSMPCKDALAAMKGGEEEKTAK